MAVFCICFLLSHMNKQATKKEVSRVPVSTPTTPETEKKTNLGKRKKSALEENSDGLDDLDSVIMSKARKKIQKVSHSNTIDGESVPTVEKMKSEMVEVSFVQTKMALCQWL